MNNLYTEYNLAEIEKKLTRTTVKACNFFATNDLLLQSFETALNVLANTPTNV